MEKTKLEQQESFAHVEESQSSHTNENVPPNGDADKIPMNDPVFENKVDSIQPLMDNGNMHNPAAEPFIPSYGDNVLPQTNGYEKNEVIKLKKVKLLIVCVEVCWKLINLFMFKIEQYIGYKYLLLWGFISL